MASGTDLVFRIFAESQGEGFKKTAMEADEAANEVLKLGERTDEVGAKRPDIKVNADTAEADRKLKDAGKAADDAGGSAGGASIGFGSLHAKVLLTAGGVGMLGPALAALPALFAGLAAAGGTLALGFAGISKAVQDYGAATGGAGTSSAQLAQTAFSNAQAIKGAEQSIADARRQAAVAAQNSADAVRTAQQGVVDAERNAASAAVSAANQIVTAQQSVTTSLYQQQQAEQSLAMAKASAQDQIDGANNSAADSQLAVESATNNVTKAQAALIAANAAYGTGSQQAKDADLALRQAKQQVIDAQLAQQIATKKATEANQEGVDGIPSVVSAQHAAEQAALGVAAAQKAAADAAANAAQQQATSAQTVGKAQEALAKAQRAASDQQISSNEQVAKSIQALADVQKQQQLAAAAAAASSSGAANQFAADMAKLTPAGRAFVEQLLSMKGGLTQLKDTAQTSMLPGLTTMLRDTAPLLPIFTGAVGQIGSVIGGIGVQLGGLFSSPVFQGQLTGVLRDGVGLVSQLGTALAPMFSALIGAASTASPLIGALGQGFHDIMASGIPAFLQGLSGGFAGAGQGIGALLSMVSGLLGPIGQLVGTLGAQLGPVIAQLAPVIGGLVRSLVDGLGPIIKALAPIILALAKPIADALLPIIQALAPLIAQFATTLGTALVPIVQTLAPVIVTLVQAFAQMMPVLLPIIQMVAQLLVGALQALLPVIVPLIPVVVQMFQAFYTAYQQVLQPLIPVVLQIVDAVVKLTPVLMPIIQAAMQIFNAFLPILPIFAQLVAMILTAVIPILTQLLLWFGKLIDYVIGPLTAGIVGIITVFKNVMTTVNDDVKAGIQWVTDKWDVLVGWFKALPGKLASAGSKMWDWIGDSFKHVVNIVIGWWNDLNFTMPKIHIPGTNVDVGGFTIGVGHIPLLAAGGTAIEAGMAWVGERGPELIHMPKGASVIPNQQSMAMTGGTGGGAFTAMIDLRLDGRVIDQQLVKFQRQGGTLESVQRGTLAALGTAAR